MGPEEPTEDQIAERFLIEILSTEGGLDEDEITAAWGMFENARINASIIDLWNDGVLRVSYRDGELAYSFTEFGKTVAERMSNQLHEERDAAGAAE